MLPIEFPEKNFTYTKPASMTDEECSSLDVYKDEAQGRIISVWKPSYEDLQALNNGGVIYLDMYSNVQPPIAMYTENPFIHSEQTT